jgi:hypothetical protein
MPAPEKYPDELRERATRLVVEARQLAAYRRALGTRKKARALTCWRQAVFALVWFRDRGVDLRVLGAGIGISRATAYRYRDEVLLLLADHAPDLTDALQRVQTEGWSHVILDGKVIDTDRCHERTISKKGKTIDVWYAGKTHDSGGKFPRTRPWGTSFALKSGSGRV